LRHARPRASPMWSPSRTSRPRPASVLSQEGEEAQAPGVGAGRDRRHRVDAVRRWRFEPARKGGVKVSVRWRYQQTFDR